jgi:hypothetical protein
VLVEKSLQAGPDMGLLVSGGNSDGEIALQFLVPCGPFRTRDARWLFRGKSALI